MQRGDTKQHYVSQFLLRGFHAASEVQIWVFDKWTGRSFRAAIKDVASEHGFYNVAGSAKIDEVIGKVEDATAPIVEDLRTRKTFRSLNDDKRAWLAGLTALQYVRTRAFSERSQDMMKQFRHVVTQMSRSNLSKKVRKQLGMDAPGSEHEKTVGMILGLVRQAVNELLNKTLILYRSDPSLPFWIGDSPVAMHNTTNPGDELLSTLGLGVTGIEIYLPISSEIVLAHMCPSISAMYVNVDEEFRRMGFIHPQAREYLHALATGSSIPMRKEHVRFQKSLQVVYAERFVYSPIDNFDHARQMLEENPKLKAGPRTELKRNMGKD